MIPAVKNLFTFLICPSVCTISIYTLNGSPGRIIINRNNTDPENSLEMGSQNSGGRYVANGMYIVFVDCKGSGNEDFERLQCLQQNKLQNFNERKTVLITIYDEYGKDFSD